MSHSLIFCFVSQINLISFHSVSSLCAYVRLFVCCASDIISICYVDVLLRNMMNEDEGMDLQTLPDDFFGNTRLRSPKDKC